MYLGLSEVAFIEGVSSRQGWPCIIEEPLNKRLIRPFCLLHRGCPSEVKSVQ